MPEVHVDTYGAYKDGTKRITTWLVRAAERCGTSPIFLDGSVANGDLQGTMLQQSKLLIPIDTLIGLAQAVASSTEPKINLPQSIACLISKIMDLLNDADDFFSNFKGVKQANDENCKHLASILDEVLTILQPSMDAKRAENHEKNAKSLADLLENLSMEEDFSNGKARDSKISESQPTQSTEYDIGGSEDDRAFAIFTLFKDFNAIREYLRTAWSDYLDGKLDVMSASVTTDTALHLLRVSCSNMVQNDTGFPSITGIVRNHVNESGDSFRDSYDRICGNVALLLQEYERTLQITRTPVAIPGALGVYDPKRDRSTLTAEEEFTEDRIILLELLPEFTCLSRVREEFPVSDLLTTGLKQMMYVNQMEALPAYALFGSQLLLDTHHILRAKVVRPFQELRATAKRIIHAVDSYFYRSQGRNCTAWTPEHDEMLRQLQTFAKSWAFSDQIGNIPRGAMRGMRPKPYHLLKNHPVLCGLLNFRLNMMMNDVGIQLCNAWGSVIASAHLYNAVRQSDYLEQKWDDMEYLITLQSEDRIFQGSRPTIAANFGKRLKLVLGISAVENHDRCANANGVSFERSADVLKDSSPVKDIFRDRYMNDGSIELSATNIAAMLEYAANFERSRPASTISARFASKTAMQWPYTPVQLLQAAREGVASEEMHLLFDYFGLHQRTCRLLEDVARRIHDKLKSSPGTDDRNNEPHLPVVVARVFDALVGTDHEAGESVLREASLVFATFLEGGEGATSIAFAKPIDSR